MKNRLNVLKYGYVYNWLRPAGFIANIKQFFTNLKYAYQRVVYGYCNQDIWNLDEFYRVLFIDTLKKLQEIRCGYPANLTDESWTETLNTLVDLFEQSDFELADTENPYQEAWDKIIEKYSIDLFKEHTLTKEEEKIRKKYFNYFKTRTNKIIKTRKKALKLFSKNFDYFGD